MLAGRHRYDAVVSTPPPFVSLDGERVVATESTRGPWSRHHQHGGPPAALLARAMEGLAGEGTALARLTFDFLRPVPIAPLALRAEVTRAGAKVLRLQAALVAPDGTPCVQAFAVALRTTPALPGSAPPGRASGTATAPSAFRSRRVWWSAAPGDRKERILCPALRPQCLEPRPQRRHLSPSPNRARLWR